MKEYIVKITLNRIITRESFWKSIRPFLTSKVIISENKIFLFEGEELVNNQSKVAEILSVSYSNVVEKLSGTKPSSVLGQGNTNLSKATDIIAEKQFTPEC